MIAAKIITYLGASLKTLDVLGGGRLPPEKPTLPPEEYRP
jgi:hypothetical protein